MNRYFYDEHARTCDDEDFWGQVKRTVNGQPVDQHQIDLIVSAICAGLDIQPEDWLLDLCCGNGALSSLIFRRCRGGLGVDLSERLVEVAQRHFEVAGRETYRHGDALAFVAGESATDSFTKALCYGSFCYFSRDESRDFLRNLQRRFPSVTRAYLGNIADLDRIWRFFKPDAYQPGIENDPASPIGVWWSQDQLRDLAAAGGWHAEFFQPPDDFYAAHYRFDAILTRVDGD